MTDILRCPHTAHGRPGPEEPHLPPIYILNRTTLDPEHFDATKHAAIPLTALGMPPTTAITLLDATEIPAPLPATLTPPPTIQPRSHHPKLDLNGATVAQPKDRNTTLRKKTHQNGNKQHNLLAYTTLVHKRGEDRKHK